MLRIRPVFLAFAALVLGTGALVGVTAAGARADDAKLCQQYQVARVSGGSYVVQNNEWDSSALECITTDGGAEFLVVNSAISNATDGAPGAYPSIFGGCHWGDCTTGGLGVHPLLLSNLGGGMVQSSWSTTDPSASEDAYDVAYDIWINQTPTSGPPDGTEVMVWLNHHGPVQPAGSVVATDVLLGGHRYDVWYSPGSSTGDTISYEMTSPRTGVTDLDIGTIIKDVERRGYTQPSWYLISVEAGFEIWRGGAGLATRSFSVNLMRDVHGWSTSGHGIQPLRWPRLGI